MLAGYGAKDVGRAVRPARRHCRRTSLLAATPTLRQAMGRDRSDARAPTATL
jgi:hypothetical protein